MGKKLIHAAQKMMLTINKQQYNGMTRKQNITPGRQHFSLSFSLLFLIVYIDNYIKLEVVLVFTNSGPPYSYDTRMSPVMLSMGLAG